MQIKCELQSNFPCTPTAASINTRKRQNRQLPLDIRTSVLPSVLPGAASLLCRILVWTSLVPFLTHVEHDIQLIHTYYGCAFFLYVKKIPGTIQKSQVRVSQASQLKITDILHFATYHVYTSMYMTAVRVVLQQ